ncbi:ATP-binding protein [Trichlorobacter ammonificans]|uniref:histidine kinase n=1 Tax=Trichlorobacter ammonificans TaxID=2916410 RepID=A0ABN8HG16_9BACT|nr:ATP-binding protein [Trichlorobacter ammonificans]CAH2031782.1 Histidine kinase [Trichlorobacter ammonificans]
MIFSNLRRQVLVPLTLTFLVLLGSFLYSAYAIRRNTISDALDRHYHEAQSLFNELLSIRSEWMIATAEPIVIDPFLKNAMRHGDRTALYRQALPYYRRMAGPEGISHLTVYGPDAATVLSIHAPREHVGGTAGNTVRRALESGRPAHGLELAPSGMLALRLVIPWYDATGLLGFIELGSEIGGTMRKLAAISHVDYLVGLDKSLLDRKIWEASVKGAGQRSSWDLLPAKVVSGHSLPRIPDGLVAMLSQPAARSFDGQGWKNIRLDDRRFAAKRFPLVETGGRVVGEFVLLHDTTRIAKDFSNFVLKVVLLGLGICSVLFAFAWRILGQVEARLQTAQQKLADEVANVNRTNTLLEQEVAERQRVEAELIHLNDHLEERVAERTRTLEAMSRELEQGRNELEQAYTELKSRQAVILHQDKMASIGLLAAGVAHDINNPIGFVTNNLEELRVYMTRLQRFLELQQAVAGRCSDAQELEDLARERHELGVDLIFEDFDTLIAESLEGAGRVSSIVRNLRNFSRVDDVEYKRADINECLESTIAITHHELRHKALVHRRFGTIPKIRCYPQQLNQVFMNLLINAAHAIEKRGEVTVSTWAADDAVFISIADTGSGIAPENLSRIFEPFFTTKDVGQGTGLGLSIVYDIVSQHHGEIRVESVPGAGTTFIIRLPLDTGDEVVSGGRAGANVGSVVSFSAVAGGGNVR